MGAISYTVGEAAEATEGSASGYTVPVTVKPLELNIKDQLTEWAQGLEEDEYDIEDLDAFYQKLYGEIAAMLKDAIGGEGVREEDHQPHRQQERGRPLTTLRRTA